jgi:hypothetical protein
VPTQYVTMYTAAPERVITLKQRQLERLLGWRFNWDHIQPATRAFCSQVAIAKDIDPVGVLAGLLPVFGSVLKGSDSYVSTRMRRYGPWSAYLPLL